MRVSALLLVLASSIAVSPCAGQSSDPAAATVDSFQPPRRPPAGWRAAWIAGEEGLARSEINTTLPLLGPFGTPPPLIKFGFGWTNLFAADQFDLPSDLFEYSAGLTWIRPVNQRWTVLGMLGAVMATDNQNGSSDAWRFRGGAFAIYQRCEKWKWTLGAVATGRDDLPVLPAVGLIWQPSPALQFDVTFPRPRVNYLVADHGSRQHWAYLGAAINGTTWGYETSGRIDDRLTYRDWRLVAGWETRPASDSPLARGFGKTIQAEIGYAFAREFEFENDTRVEALDDGFLMGITTRF